MNPDQTEEQSDQGPFCSQKTPIKICKQIREQTTKVKII